MQRNIIASVFLAILVVGLVPIGAFAEDAAPTDAAVPTLTAAAPSTTGTDADTEREVRDMDNGPGATVRLLQLEKALTRAKLHGQQVIDALNAQNGTNATAVADLESIEAEFDVMIAQVQQAEKDVNNTENATQVFVAIKSDARDLVKRFHDAAAPLLKDADKQKLRESMQKVDRDQLKDITDKIEKNRRQANSERVAKAFENAGIEPSEALKKAIEDGTATPGDVQKELRAQLKTMTPEQRKEAAAKMRDQNAKERVQTMAKLERAEQKLGDREGRLQERIAFAQEQGKDNLAAHMQERVGKMQERGAKIDERQARLENRSGNGSGRGEGRGMGGLRPREAPEAPEAPEVTQ